MNNYVLSLLFVFLGSDLTLTFFVFRDFRKLYRSLVHLNEADGE